MRVAFLLNSLGLGGSERKVIRVSNEMAKRGISVHLLYLGGDECLKNNVDAAVNLVNVKSNVNGLYAGNKFVYHYLKQHNIDNLFTVNMYPLLFIMLSRFVIGKRFNWIALINTTYFETTKKELQMLIYRPVLSLTSKNIFGANNQLEIWRSKYFFGKSSPLEVLYNGVDTQRFNVNQLLSQNAEEISKDLCLNEFQAVFVSVAQLRVEKGHKDIIDAAAQAKKLGRNYAFVFVGKGSESYENELKRYAQRKDVVNNIKFIGQVADPRPYLICSDAFVLASETETFSNAALEAMSLGLPAILSDVGGAGEMVENGFNGFLFEKNEEGSLFSALEAYVASDSKLLSKNAISRIKSNFTFEKMVENYIKLTQENR